MKKIMKKMPKKVLSMLLAVIMIASCMSVCFSVLAEEISFNVTSGSPAIPLYVGYKIAASNLTFNGEAATLGESQNTSIAKIEDGYLVGVASGNTTVKLGDNTVHVIVAEKGASENVNDFSLYYSDFSNATDINDWVAGSETLTGNATANLYITGGFLYSASNVITHSAGDTALKINKNATQDQKGVNAAFLKSDILKDFGDYSVSADFKNSGGSTRGQMGILSRALLVDNINSITSTDSLLQKADYNSTKKHALSLRFRQRGAVMVAGTTAGGANRSLSDENNTYTFYNGSGLTDANFNTTGTNVVGHNSSKNIKIDYLGNGFRCKLDDTTILDTINLSGSINVLNIGFGTESSDTSNSSKWTYTSETAMTATSYGNNYTSMGISDKGTIGFVNGCASDLYIYNVRVDAANIKDITDWGFMEEVTGGGSEEPEPEEPEPEDPTPTDDDDDTEPTSSGVTFNVTAESPAIPLNVGKKIALCDLRIAGLSATYSDLTWERLVPNNNTEEKDIEVTQYYIKGYKAGVYGFTVSEKENPTKTQNVWVVVRPANDSNYNIIDVDFTRDDIDTSDWLTSEVNTAPPSDKPAVSQSSPYLNGAFVKVDETPTLYDIQVEGADTKQKALKIESTNNKDYTRGYFYIHDLEMMNNFKDYNISAKLASKLINSGSSISSAAVGIFARATLKENLTAVDVGETVLDNTTKSMLFRFRNVGGIAWAAFNGTNERTSGTTWEVNCLTSFGHEVLFTSSNADKRENNPVEYNEYVLGKTEFNQGKNFQPNLNTDTSLKVRQVDLKLDGKRLKYTLDTNTVFDTVSDPTNTYIKKLSYTFNTNALDNPAGSQDPQDAISAENNNWPVNIQAQTGTIGFSSNYGADTYVFGFAVTPENILDQATSIPTILRDFSSSSDTPVAAGEGYNGLPAGTFPVVPESPAIPLYVNKSLTLDQISVKLHDSEKDQDVWVNGADRDLVWEKQEGRAARLSEDKTKFEGRMTGNTLFTVSYNGGTPQNVWVIVNEKNDSDFYIVDYNFDEGDDYYEWQISQAVWGNEDIYTYGGYKVSGMTQRLQMNNDIMVADGNGDPVNKPGLVLKPAYETNSTSAAFLKRKELEDFSDYTVNAELSYVRGINDNQTEGVIDAAGILARVDLNDELYEGNLVAGETPILSNKKALHFRFRNYGGVTISAYANGDRGDATALNPERPYATYFTVGTDENPAEVAASLWKGTTETTKVWIEDASNATAYTLRNVELKLDGNATKYTLDNEVIFDTTNPANKVYGLSVDKDNILVDDGNGGKKYNLGTYNDIPCPTPEELTTYSSQADNVDVLKGTIGFSVTGEKANGQLADLVIYSVKVTPENILLYPPEALDYEEETYKAEYSINSAAPIIPLTKGNRLVLDNLYIEMPEGTAGRDVDGYVYAASENLVWTPVSSKESTPSVVRQATTEDGKKTIEGWFNGRVCFTVRDKDHPELKQNVWIVVSDTDEDKYTLLDFDFTDISDENVFDAAMWICGSVNDNDDTIGYTGHYQSYSPADFHHGYQNGAFKYIPQTDVLGYDFITVDTGSGIAQKRVLKLASQKGTTEDAGKVTRIAVYKSEMLKDFKDYKISADVANVMTTAEENTISSIGILARASINENASSENDLVLSETEKSTMFRMRNYGGLGVYAYRGDNAINCEKPGDETGHERMWLGGDFDGVTYWSSALVDSDNLKYYNSGYNGYTMKPDESGSQNEGATVKNLSIELNEFDMKYILNEHTILDTANNIWSAGGYWDRDQVGADKLYKNLVFRSAPANTTPTTASYKANMHDPNIASIKDKPGTIGLSVNYGVDLYVLGLKVEAVNEVEQTVPQEPFERPNDVNATVLINTRVKLSDIESNLTMPDYRCNAYEIRKNEMLVFGPAGTTIKPYNDKSLVITIKDPDYVGQNGEIVIKGEPFAEKAMRIVPLSGTGHSSNDYHVTVNNDNDGIIYPDGISRNKEIKPGTLEIKHDKDVWEKIISGNNDGCSYDFTVIDPLKFEIRAEYTTCDKNMTNITIMGSTIRVPSSSDQSKGEALRFLTRIPALKARKDQYTKAYVWWPDFETTTDGKKFAKFVSFGSFILPTPLLEAAGGKFTPPADFAPKTDPEFEIGGYRVRNAPINIVTQATEKYSDVWSSLEYGTYVDGADMDILDIPVSIVSYIYYTDEDGNSGYIFSDVKSESYYDVYEKAYPVTNSDKTLKGTAVKNIYRYQNNENVTFALEVLGNYQLDWKITNKDGNTVQDGITAQAPGRFAVTVAYQDGLKFEANVKGRASDYNHANPTEADIITYNTDKEAWFCIDAYGNYSEDPEDDRVPSVANLNNTYVKAQEGTLNVAYVGGSVTYGQNASNADNTSWRGRTREWLKTAFGETITINENNQGNGGISSVYKAPTFEKLVLEHTPAPDLIFIDCSINDRYVGLSEEQSAALMDSMIRQARAKYPDVDIVVVTVPDSTTITKTDPAEVPNAEAHRKVAEHENVNYIDLTDTAKAMYNDSQSGGWEHYFWNEAEKKVDSVHPNNDGYAKYAATIEAEMEKLFDDAAEANLTGTVNYIQPENAYNSKVPSKYEIIPADSNRMNKEGTWQTVAASSHNSLYSQFNLNSEENAPKTQQASSGAKMTFEFTGVSLIMLGSFPTGSNIEVKLDGGDIKTIASLVDAGQVYLYDDLPETTHTVTIEVKGSESPKFGCFAVGKVDSDIEGEKPPVVSAYDPREVKTVKSYYINNAFTETQPAPIISSSANPQDRPPSIPEHNPSTSDNMLSLIRTFKTNLDGVENAGTQALGYNVGDTITFTIEAYSGYKIKWELYKDNAAINAITTDPDANGIGGEYISYNNKGPAANESDRTLYVDHNAPVKTGIAEGLATISTKMKEAGTVLLVCTVLDATTGETIKYKRKDTGAQTDAVVNLAAVAGYQQIVQPLNSANAKPEDQDEFIDDLRIAVQTRSADISDTVINDMVAFINNFDLQTTATFDRDSIKLILKKIGTDYRSFYYEIPTGISNPSHNYNERPATGIIRIPTSNITGIEGYYQSYGSAAANASDISKQMGISVGSNPIVLLTYANGQTDGTAHINEMVAASQNDLTDPKDSYAYGMIFRDYLALVIAKRLYNKLVPGGTPIIGASGTSQGGFQAVWMAALDEDFTQLKVVAPWMCSVGQEKSNYILSGFMPYCEEDYYFSTVSAAEYIAEKGRTGFTASVGANLGDTTAPLNGVIALFNAFCANDTFKVSFGSNQAKFHNYDPLEETALPAYTDVPKIGVSWPEIKFNY